MAKINIEKVRAEFDNLEKKRFEQGYLEEGDLNKWENLKGQIHEWTKKKGNATEEERKAEKKDYSTPFYALPVKPKETPKPEKKPEPPVLKPIEKAEKKEVVEPLENIEVVDEEEEKAFTPEEKKQNSFLKSWAATHPSWAKILTSKDLSFGQKVQLVGSALANLGANVTLGAKAGFEHSGFQPIDWDFKKAIDKYTSNEIDSVLAGEQQNRTKVETADFWKDYRKAHGDEAADELIALVDLYGDNPVLMQERLKSMGINKSADEIKKLYANLEKTNLSQEAKQKMLDTEAKRLENKIKELQAKVTGETAEKLIEAQNALNNYNNIKYSSDGKTYNIEKAGNYLRNILHEVEGVASTVGGVMTGGVVGGVPSVKDGLVKAPGIPQKIVRADGSEIQLDPNDNIYATKNELTTEKDNGSAIVPMNRDDEVITVQKKLGYSGGFINKDFNYYLKKLRG